MQMFKTKIAKIIELTDDVRQFVLEYSLDFEAGQFLMIDIEDGKEPKAIRAYSIASGPGENELYLAIKLVDGGRGSQFLAGLSEGDELTVKGPFGHFVLDQESEKDVLMVATGTGVAPMHSMLVENLASGRKMTLLFGVRHIKDVFWKEKFEELAAKHPNFDFKLTLSRPEDESWNGLRGRVTDHFDGFDPVNLQVYICGSKSMIDSVKTHFLEAGVPESDVMNEVFWAV